METAPLKPIAILGAGSWGTALALYLSRRGQVVNLWSIETPHIETMVKERTNNQYLPGHPFPDTLHPIPELKKAIQGVDDILMVVPSAGFHSTLDSLKPLLHDKSRIICATKGLDSERGQLLHDIVIEVLGKSTPYAVLSGPSFAKEVGAGLPAAVVIASKDSAFTEELTQRFNSPIFRIDPSTDTVGVEISGVVKNVIAMAAGMSDGMALGANARCAIITRGLKELTDLGLALGGQSDTFTGLAGVGDMMLTCGDDLSRNRRMGLAIGKGHNTAAAEREIGQVVEGKRNNELVVELAKQHGVVMPVCNAMLKVLRNELSPKDAFSIMLDA